MPRCLGLSIATVKLSIKCCVYLTLASGVQPFLLFPSFLPVCNTQQLMGVCVCVINFPKNTYSENIYEKRPLRKYHIFYTHTKESPKLLYGVSRIHNAVGFVDLLLLVSPCIYLLEFL